jgi:hypothetical protein
MRGALRAVVGRWIAGFGQLPEAGAGRRAPIHSFFRWWYASGYLTLPSLPCPSSSAATRASLTGPTVSFTPPRLAYLLASSASSASSYRSSYMLTTPLPRHPPALYTRSQSPSTHFWPSLPPSPPQTATQLSQGLPQSSRFHQQNTPCSLLKHHSIHF